MVNGRKIRELRVCEQLTTTEFAQRVGASQTTIVHIEKEFKQPSVCLLKRIADYFQCKVDDLLKESA